VVWPGDFCVGSPFAVFARIVSVCRGSLPPNLLARNLTQRRPAAPVPGRGYPRKRWGTGGGGWRNDPQRRCTGVDPRAIVGDRSPRVIGDGVWPACACRSPDEWRAIRERCTGPFIAAWALGIVGVCAARIGFASLAFYGSPAMSRGLPDPLSGAEIWRFLRACEGPIALAVGSGVLIALWLRRGGEIGATAASSREARSRRIGAAGEARVAGELKRIGLPALHNVILSGAGWSVELDHVIRVPRGSSCWRPRPSAEGSPANSPRQSGHSAPPAVYRSSGWTIQCCRTRRMSAPSMVFWAICGCRYAVTWSRPVELGLRRRSRTRSFPSGICHGCCRFLLQSRTRAFSMRRGGGSSARRRRAAAARSARGVCAPPTGGVASAAAVIACAPGVLRTPEGGLPRRDLGQQAAPVPGVV
jgi:hypothetical protein